MIERLTEDGVIRIVVRCELCQELIEEAPKGLYFWDSKSPDSDGVRYAHKQCTFQVVPWNFSWHELVSLPVFLMNNLGLTTQKKKLAAVRFAENWGA